MAFSGPSKSRREAEAVLMVVSDDPAAVHSQVARLERLSGLELGSAVALKADDTYFDSSDKSLTYNGLSLRLRRLADRTLIGLKGNEEWTERGVLRLELDAPWSSNALADVLHELDFREIRLVWPGIAINGASPEDVLGAMGLAAFQSRRLVRSTRAVLKRSGNAIAELALDIVTQEVDGTRVVYREVEVEADESSVVSDITEAILSAVPDGLRKWSHSKLATGPALEQLSRSRAPAVLVSADGDLTPAAIEALGQELNQR